jgi:translation initiation factor IF-3
MVMVVAPLKNKSEAKAEQNAVRTAHTQAAREAKNDAAAARKDAPAA